MRDQNLSSKPSRSVFHKLPAARNQPITHHQLHGG
jgi:hypothetical protein